MINTINFQLSLKVCFIQLPFNNFFQLLFYNYYFLYLITLKNILLYYIKL